MQAILDAMTEHGSELPPALLDLVSGEVVHDTTDVYPDPDLSRMLEDEPERFEEVPRQSSHEGFRLMASFAEQVADDDIRDDLAVALSGRGAFGRFRDVIRRYPEIDRAWQAFERDALLASAGEWLASLGIEPVYELAPIAPPANPVTRAPEGRVGLLDLLLLGAPDGKTELLEGRVLRTFKAASADEARVLFKRLARELCEHFGLPWRKRFAQGTSRFDLERAHLTVDGRSIDLWIDVAPSTWRAFSE